MGLKRPFKVTYHYDPSAERSQTIDGTESSHDLSKVRELARVVSRAGGWARVWVSEPGTNEDYTLREYAPFEAALDDLVNGLINDLTNGV